MAAPSPSHDAGPDNAGTSHPVDNRGAVVDVRNSTMMVEKPGLLLSLLGRIFFSRVTFDDELVGKVNDLRKEGIVAYVMSSQSLLDYIYFNWAFLKKGLPRAVFGKGMRMWPFRTVGALVLRLWRLLRRRKTASDADILENAPLQDKPVVLFLRKARSMLPWSGEFREDPLRGIVLAQRRLDRPIFIVPIVLVWERTPTRFRRSVVDMIFGDPDAPGRLRKVVNFVANHRRAIVQLGEPLDMRTFLEEHEHLERDEALGQKARWELNQRFRLEQKVIKGPLLKNAARIREEILRLEPFAKQVAQVAEESGRPVAEVRAEADRYLKEIIADWKFSYVEVFCWILTFVFARIYAGIEARGLGPVREAAKRTPIVVLPSHKSHIDYLLISYVFYGNALVPPHIAAGNNLNFWPLGHMFRHAGAFFLRRSFKQNPLYAESFRTYVHKLLKEGYSMEFFIEGGRSRTGKLLRPRFGLLGHVIDAVVEGHTHDLSLCPAAIDYEKIVEGESYARELSGAKKESESLGGVFKATRVLRERFGRVYLSFDAPVSVRTFLTDEGVDLERGFESDAERRLIIKKLAFRVLHGINHAIVATASAVVATALLVDARRGMSRELVLRRVGALIIYLQHRGVGLASGLRTPLQANRVALERTRSATGAGTVGRALAGLDGSDDLPLQVGITLGSVIDETLAMFARNKSVTQTRYVDGTIVIQLPPQRRQDLDYYRNTLVHAFVREGILAVALRRCAREDGLFGDRLRNETRFMSGLLRNEYVFPQGRGFDASYRDTLQAFEDAHLLEGDRAARITLPRAGRTTLRLLSHMVLPVIEGYYIAGRSVLVLDDPIPDKELYARMQRDGDRLWREGEITFKEAVSSVTFQNALLWYRDLGMVESSYQPIGRKGREVRVIGPGSTLESDPEQLPALLEKLKRFLVRFG